MTTYRLWDTEPSPLPGDFDEGVHLALGTEFYVTSAAWLTGISFLMHTNTFPDGATVALFQADSGSTGTLIGSWPVTTTNYQHFVETTLPTPIALTVNQRYKAVLYMDRAFYKASANYWNSGDGASGRTSGPLVAPSAFEATASAQGTFHYDSFDYPNNTFNSGNYWVQPIVSDVDPGGPPAVPEGAADLDFNFDVTAAGSRPAKGGAALDVSFELAAAGRTSRSGSVQLDAIFDVAAAGRTERRGAADLDLRYDVTAAGHAPTLDVPTGGAALDASFDLTVSGRTTRSGAAALTASYDLTVAGQAPGQTQQRVTARLSADNVTVTLSAENVTTRIEE